MLKAYCPNCQKYFPVESKECTHCGQASKGIPTAAVETASAVVQAPGASPQVTQSLAPVPEPGRLEAIDPVAEATLGQMVGESPEIRSARGLVRMASKNRLPVLITGESGTGKTLLAQVIHELSGGGQFVLIRPTRASEVRRFIGEGDDEESSAVVDNDFETPGYGI